MVIVLEVIGEDPLEVLLVQHDDMVEAFPANRSDHAFAIRILPGRLRRIDHFLDTHVGDPPAKFAIIDAVSVPDEYREHTRGEGRAFE